MAHPLVEESLVTARDDPHSVVGVCGKLLEVADNAVGRDGCLRLPDNRRESAVVVEHEQALLRLAVLGQQLRTVEQRCGVRLVERGKVRKKTLEVAGRPVLHGVAGDVVKQALVNSGLFCLGHCEGRVDRICSSTKIPRVDVHGITETTGCTREL